MIQAFSSPSTLPHDLKKIVGYTVPAITSEDAYYYYDDSNGLRQPCNGPTCLIVVTV